MTILLVKKPNSATFEAFDTNAEVVHKFCFTGRSIRYNKNGLSVICTSFHDKDFEKHRLKLLQNGYEVKVV